MKGILIEKRSRKSIIMDQNGRFMKTKTMKSWNEGDEVSFMGPAVKTAKVLSIAVAFVLVFALGLFVVYTNNAYTVTLDVNPSIEIEVNAFNNIASIQALNDDAENIGDLSGLVGMKFGPAVNVAIQLLLDQGYLEEDGTVVLSIEGKNGKLRTVVQEVSEFVTDAIIESEDDEEETAQEGEEVENGEPKIKIYVGRITEEMADKAEELGVPVGRMVLAAKAQEEGAEISYDMAAMLSVQELQRIRNLSKTINKVTELLAESSEQGQEAGNGHLKQIEAMTEKILREASKIEENLEKLAALIASGEADDEMIERHAVLTIQLESLLMQMEQMGIAADMETEEILNGMSQYKGADAEEKARIREEIKEAKKAEIDAKQEENRTRVEEKMAEVKEKVAMLKSISNEAGEEEDEENEDEDDNGNNGNNGKGKGNN